MPNEQQAQRLCRIIEIFRSYDKENEGSLDRNQFTDVIQILTDEGLLNASKHPARVFDEVDRSGDGQINFNELIAWFINVGIFNNTDIENS